MKIHQKSFYCCVTSSINHYKSITLSQKDPDTAEISRVHPTSTSRLTSGLALRSTLRLTLYNTINVTLTLSPLTTETNMESRKDHDNAEKNWVQLNSTSRPTSGQALRSTLRLTLTLRGNNNNNVYQYNTIYMTLTLRPTTSEINMESHKDPNNADIKCVTLALSSTSRLTTGLASRTTLRLTLNMTFNPNSIWCKNSAPLSKVTSNLTGDKKSMITTTVARTK
jgi:hypothetical protein